MAAKQKKGNTPPPPKAAPVAAAPPGRSEIWVPAIILLVTALIYSRALGGQFTSIDDDYYILKNPYIRDLSLHGIKAIFTSFYSYNYHPLTTLTYLLQYSISGLNPLPYHAVNVLLHLLNTWLAYRLAYRLSGRKITAIVVSALFAIHPMHVESVAWISERKDVLYTACYLWSLLIYERYLGNGLQKSGYWQCLAVFLLALLSKPAAVTLPVLLLAIDLYKGRQMTKAVWLEKIPFLVLAVVFGIVNIKAQAAGGAINNELMAVSWANKIFFTTYALSCYLVMLVAPVGLSAMHYYPAAINGVLPLPYYLSAPFIVLVTLLVFRRGPMRKTVLFGAAFFLITIMVMLQIVAVGATIIAERYTYVPYIGLFYIIGEGAALAQRTRWQRPVLVTLGLAGAIFPVLTWQRIGIWQNDKVLFGDIATHYPDRYQYFFEKAGKKKAASHLREALQMYNVTLLLHPGFGPAYLGRAEVYDKMRTYPLAIEDYDSLIAAEPQSAAAYNYRGFDYSNAGNMTAAIADLNKAITLNPGYAEAYNNRGWAQYQAGDTAAAMNDYRRAVTLDTGFSMAYNNIGWTYYQSGNMDSALKYFNRAVATNPSNSLAMSNRAAVEANAGNTAAAKADYDRMIQLNPQNQAAYLNRGIIRLSTGDTAAALTDWRQSAQLGNQTATELLSKFNGLK